MRLSEFAGRFEMDMVRDGPFSTPGLMSSPQVGMLTFLDHRKSLPAFGKLPGVAAVITAASLVDELSFFPGAIAVAESPRRTFFQLHNHLAAQTSFYWDDFPTEIHPSARVHPRAWVAEKNVRIGAETEIRPNATICERASIGDHVVIHPGVVLGSSGLQSTVIDGVMVDVLHAGGIRIEASVHLLANTVVANAIFRQCTTVGEACRVGNQVFISHNCQIGGRTFIGHGSVINGNVRMGQEVWIGPGATLIQRLTIGDRARITAGSCVIQDVLSDHQVTGNIAIDHNRFLRHIASIG